MYHTVQDATDSVIWFIRMRFEQAAKERAEMEDLLFEVEQMYSLIRPWLALTVWFFLKVGLQTTKRGMLL